MHLKSFCRTETRKLHKGFYCRASSGNRNWCGSSWGRSVPVSIDQGPSLLEWLCGSTHGCFHSFPSSKGRWHCSRKDLFSCFPVSPVRLRKGLKTHCRYPLKGLEKAWESYPAAIRGTGGRRCQWQTGNHCADGEKQAAVPVPRNGWWEELHCLSYPPQSQAVGQRHRDVHPGNVQNIGNRGRSVRIYQLLVF